MLGNGFNPAFEKYGCDFYVLIGVNCEREIFWCTPHRVYFAAAGKVERVRERERPGEKRRISFVIDISNDL